MLSSNGSFPLAAIYAQATGTKGGTFCLLFIVLLSLLICLVGTLLTCGRIWWTLARDHATPLPYLFASVNEDLSCPIYATLFCTIFSLGLGAIPLGSKTAFQDLAGSFIILTSTSYALAIAPNLLTGRKNVPKGPFHLGSAGFAINAAAVLLIIFFNIMYCFRKYTVRKFRNAVIANKPPLAYGLPTTVQAMNYNSVILVGVVVLTTAWWFIHGGNKYKVPAVAHKYLDGKI